MRVIPEVDERKDGREVFWNDDADVIHGGVELHIAEIEPPVQRNVRGFVEVQVIEKISQQRIHS